MVQCLQFFGGKMFKAQKQRLNIYKLTNGSQTITIKSKVGNTLMASSLYKVWRRMFTSFFPMKFELYRKTLHFIETASVQVNPEMIPNVPSTGAQTLWFCLTFCLLLFCLTYIYILFCLTFMSQQKHCFKVQAQWYTKNILEYTLIFGYQIWTS